MTKEKIVLQKIKGWPNEIFILRLMTAIQSNEMDVIEKFVLENDIEYFDELKDFINTTPISSEVNRIFEARELSKTLNNGTSNNTPKKKVKV
jgi:hypothetical protein